jgi:hypothetical protein
LPWFFKTLNQRKSEKSLIRQFFVPTQYLDQNPTFPTPGHLLLLVEPTDQIIHGRPLHIDATDL